MRLILTLVLLGALSACTNGRASSVAEPSGRPEPRASASPSSPPDQRDQSGTKACARVRAGINAFNGGDFETTVKKFRSAVPLARTQARTAPSPAADDLLAAVTYYAELSPAEYPASARSSEEFAEYKAITLGQCVSARYALKDSTEPPGTQT